MKPDTTLPVEDALRLLVDSKGKRIMAARVGGHTVWVKRFDAEPMPFAKRLHAAASRFLPTALRSSRIVDAAAMRKRERVKAEAFRAAGFPVPHILHESEHAIIMADAGPTLETELKARRQAGCASHDDLVVAMAATLGDAHAGELCHGRPHPRDLFMAGEAIGFLDFQEEPEKMMPLAAAQARDAWLLFMHVAGRVLKSCSEAKAFKAYRKRAPAAAIGELGKILRSTRPLMPVLRALRPFGLGSDGRRVLATSEFLHGCLSADRGLRSSPDSAPKSVSRTNT